ncbi:g protein-coupled receptor protein [Apiospora phragmitis]|uniref:G protein-coupled receptor protein n=1 Tax=Apiospora phragmitis TaxID=2905665 RepID=A0ABR1X6W0_9PEZI
MAHQPHPAFARLVVPRVANGTDDGVDKNPDGLPVSFTPHTLYILESVSLSLSTISVFAALVAFYWFVRMRRSFRQDLIMLLIQSDMMKAFWLMLCPIVYFIQGTPVDTSDTLCQVSAFFLTSAIEASDIAVLMVAIHSALFILRPQRSGGENGLYPYRRYAYAAWFVIPLILAAIVPITGQRYVNTGPHCYLPVSPLWYRMALSWIPRYIIFAVIICTYSGLYLFLGFRFYRLQLAQRRASTNTAPSTFRNHVRCMSRAREPPPTPKLASHGLLGPSPPRPAADQLPERERQQSMTSTVSTLKLDDRVPHLNQLRKSQSEPVPWNWVESDFQGLSHPQTRQFGLDSASPTTVSFALDTSGITPPEPVLRDAPKEEGLEMSVTEDALYQSRVKMRKQLRLLFVYPLMYIITWIAPFVSHIYTTSNPEHQEQPFGLLLTSVASLCIGAAVDCCFFSSWEQPWLHLQGGFIEGFARRVRFGTHKKTMGRTREEQLRDASAALDRRNQENAEREAAAAQHSERPAPRSREWWDTLEEEEIGTT